jgi:competence protein ComEC
MTAVPIEAPRTSSLLADARQGLDVHRREVVLGALALGLLATTAPRWVVVALVVVAGAGALGLRRPAPAGALVLAILLGAVLGDARLSALDRTQLGPLMGRTITVRAIVLEAPRAQPFGGWAAPVRIADGPGSGERIVARWGPQPPGSALAIGVEVRLHGRLQPLAPWDSAQRRRGAHARLQADAVAATGRRRGGVLGFVDRVRARAERGISSGLSPPQAALARGMVLGQDDALDDATRDAFRASGLAHVLAASGQNVALLALLAGAAVALAGGGLRTRLAAALALVALYVPLAGAGPSIVRAGIMGGAALVAGMAGRPASRVYALLLAAAATLAINPRSSGDIGWQLSFAAVVAIAVIAPRARAALVARRIPRPLAEAIAIPVAATAGTAPLMALHFDQVSIVSLPANLVAAPAIAPVVWLGTLAGTLGQLPWPAPFAPLLGAVLSLPLGFVALVADVAARAPHATVPLRLGIPAAIALYAVIAAVSLSRTARAAALALAVPLGVAAFVVVTHRPAPPAAPTVSFLDVGQGDATLLQEGALAVLVDTGPPGGPIVQRLRAAGVRRLALLVLTHGEADHEGAAPEILAHVPVDAVLDGGITAPAQPSDAAWTPGGGGAGAPGAPAGGGAARGAAAGGPAVEAAIDESGARRIVPAAGQTLDVGAFRLRVLWPPAGEPPAGAEPNDRAVVLLVTRGRLRLLPTADAESPVTLPLALPPVDVLKVAHHGSADPGLTALLERLRPKVAAIEVGQRNTYGHPAPSTLEALRAAVPTILRTDRDGTVRLSLEGDRLAVR